MGRRWDATQGRLQCTRGGFRFEWRPIYVLVDVAALVQVVKLEDFAQQRRVRLVVDLVFGRAGERCGRGKHAGRGASEREHRERPPRWCSVTAWVRQHE